MLLFLLLRVIRLNSRVTRTINTSSEDLSAGERSFSSCSSVLTELIAASTSISSIFNYPYPVIPERDYYRTGFQKPILASVIESEGMKKMVRLLAHLAENSAITSILQLVESATEAPVRRQLKSEKMQKNLVKHFFCFELNSYLESMFRFLQSTPIRME